MRDSAWPVAAGLLAGMILAIGSSYMLRSILYGVSAVDSVSFAGVSMLFLAVGLIAAFRPARRAASVEPSVALRYE